MNFVIKNIYKCILVFNNSAIIVLLSCFIVSGYSQSIVFRNPYQTEYFNCNYIHVEEQLIGVNWHMGNDNVCSPGFYLVNDLLGDKNDNIRPSPAPKPILFSFDSISLVDQNIFSSIFHEFDYSYYYGKLVFFPESQNKVISDDLKNQFDKFNQRYIRVTFPNRCQYRITHNAREALCDSLNLYHTGTDYIWVDCFNNTRSYNNPDIFKENVQNCLSDPWIDLLLPNLKQEHPRDYHKYLELDTFPNFYSIPISDSWQNTDHPYFKIISKAFYLMLFKCRITYACGQHMYFAVPNLNLNLNSENPEERELCRMQMIPAYQILNIQNIEPFPVSRLPK